VQVTGCAGLEEAAGWIIDHGDEDGELPAEGREAGEASGRPPSDSFVFVNGAGARPPTLCFWLSYPLQLNMPLLPFASAVSSPSSPTLDVSLCEDGNLLF
jgi:hypothetical protein